MSWRCTRLCFFGRRLVGLMLDGSHHGEGEHDERDVTMPAVPGSGFVVVEPELGFGCLEAILDRPPRCAVHFPPSALPGGYRPRGSAPAARTAHPKLNRNRAPTTDCD